MYCSFLLRRGLPQQRLDCTLKKKCAEAGFFFPCCLLGASAEERGIVAMCLFKVNQWICDETWQVSKAATKALRFTCSKHHNRAHTLWFTHTLVHTLWLNNFTVTLLLFSCSYKIQNLLLFVYGQR